MSENIRTENWCGHDIRFVEHEGNWYAVLKDICDALKLRTDNTKLRIESDHLIKTAIEVVDKVPSAYENVDHYAVGVNNFTERNRVTYMLCSLNAGSGMTKAPSG